jgi:hypothetical protein
MNRRQFLLTGSLGALGAGCAEQTVTTTAPSGLTAMQERKAMPAFSLPDLDGHIVRSSDLLGNVILLRFWATW